MSEDGSSSSSVSANSLPLKRGVTLESTPKNVGDLDHKRRKNTTAHNPETTKSADEADLKVDCENPNSSLASSVSTTLEHFAIELDAATTSAASYLSLQKDETDTGTHLGLSAENETFATVRGDDNDLIGAGNTNSTPGEGEFPAGRFLYLRRRQYRRSGQLVSSMSSESTENLFPEITDGDGNAAQDSNNADRIGDDGDNDSSVDSDIVAYMNNNFMESDDNDVNSDDDSMNDFNIDSDSTDEGGDEDEESGASRRRRGIFRDYFDRRGGENARSETASNDAAVEDILKKPLPVCKWNTLKEVLNREQGFSNRFADDPAYQSHRFNERFYASTFVVERMKRSHCLRKHKGCVNSLNFNRSGNLLCSGSDDRRIVVWDWAHNKVNHTYASGHRENIFQTKFITSGTGIDIVSAGRDGQVRRSVISSSGKAISTCLYKHRKAVHKLVICPDSQFELLSAGEDGRIRHCDLRDEPHNAAVLTEVTGKQSQNPILLFGISHHPFAPEVVVCGSDEYVRIYDKRKFDEPVHWMCPSHLKKAAGHELYYMQVTCCTYNHSGSEILATYSDEQLYLFDNKNYTDGSYLHSYCGHYNHRTIKGVNFFGPNSEYIVSGSDCGNIFYWDKETEAILNCMPGDDSGVVNCLEPHPTMPVLATSGLDYNVKIWTPGSQSTVLAKEKLKKCISLNMKRSDSKVRIQFLDRALNDFIVRTIHSNAGSGQPEGDESDGAYSFEPNSDNASTSQSESSSPAYRLGSIFESGDEDPDDNNFERLTCSTQ